MAERRNVEAFMNLSRFFTLAEMTRSDAAARASIPNEPTETEIANLRALCTAVLDPLREAIGSPIKVNSGYRGPALNTHIGGAKKSQHVEGKAADLQVPNKSILELFKTVIRLRLPFDQLIYEARSPTVVWVHVSHNASANRGQIMTAEFENGRAVRYPAISAEAALALADPSLRREAAMPEWSYVESADEPDAPDEAVGVELAAKKKKTARQKAKIKRPAKRARTKRAAKARPAKRGTKRRSVKAKTARSKKKRKR
jgi:hypothetical protein